jgi:hypothetical protein
LASDDLDLRLSRLDFLKSSGLLIAGVLASNYMSVQPADAEIVSPTPILTQPGDNPMKIGLNLHNLPTEDDLQAIESGFYQEKQFWVDSPKQLAEHDYTMMEVSKECTSQTNGSGGETFYTVPSVYSDTPYGHAPKERGLKSPYANALRKIFSVHADAAGFDPLNEPDRSFCLDGDDAPIYAAEMAITADQVMQEVGFNGLLMVPAISDTAGDFGTGFLKKFVAHIRSLEYEFKNETAISTHFYRGAKERNPLGLVTAATLARLYFPSDNKQVRGTEGGVTFETRTVPKMQDMFEYDTSKLNMRAQEIRQFEGMNYIYNLARHLAFASMKNYTEHDTQEGGGGFMAGYKNYNDKPHLVYIERERLKEQRPLSQAELTKFSNIIWQTECDMSALALSQY